MPINKIPRSELHIPGVPSKKKNKKLDPKKQYGLTWLDKVNKEKATADDVSVLTRMHYCEEKKEYNMSNTYDPFNPAQSGDGSSCSACCTTF